MWVPKDKSDVYVSSRRIAHGVKVSLHEPGPARFALTKEWVEGTGFDAPDGRDARLATEWHRPRAALPNQPVVRPLSIMVPWDEVIDRATNEPDDIMWVEPPAEGNAVHFDVIYVAAGVPVMGHPGARSMGTELVGQLELANGERVFVTAIVREMAEPLRANINKLRNFRLVDENGKATTKTGLLGFGVETNPDAGDGTYIGTLIDVTRPDEEGSAGMGA